MALKNNPIAIVLAIAITVSAVIAFGDISDLASSLSQYSGQMVWVLPLLLGATYMVSDRNLNQLSNIELGTISIPIAAMVASQYVPQVSDLVATHAPLSQIVLIGLSAGSVYVLMETE